MMVPTGEVAEDAIFCTGYFQAHIVYNFFELDVVVTEDGNAPFPVV